MLRPLIREQWLPALEGFADDTGMSELFPAMEAGLVVMKPVMLDESDDTIDRLVQEVVGLLNPNAYPLFDRTIGAVASAGVREGLFALHGRTSRHGKQVSLAEGLFGYLPTFPHASVDQILELRKDIREQRIRFREAIAALSREFTGESFDEDFAGEVRDASRRPSPPRAPGRDPSQSAKRVASAHPRLGTPSDSNGRFSATVVNLSTLIGSVRS